MCVQKRYPQIYVSKIKHKKLNNKKKNKHPSTSGYFIIDAPFFHDVILSQLKLCNYIRGNGDSAFCLFTYIKI